MLLPATPPDAIGPDPRPVRVVPWLDPTLQRGFPLQHPYVEPVWAPVLGPTATLAARRLDTLLEHNPKGVHIDVHDLGRQLGVGTRNRGGRWSPIVVALERLERYEFARWEPQTDRYALRRAVPAVSHQQLRHLPEVIIGYHRALLRAHLDQSGDGGRVARPPKDHAANVPTVAPARPGADPAIDAHSRLRALPGGLTNPPARDR